MENKFVVIDLETTGNSPKKGDKIIQFAAVVIEDGKICEEYSSLVNPQQSIPKFIEELTGLNDQMVKDAPLFEEIAPKIVELLENAYFVAHNVLFDLSFLQEELILAGFEGFFGPVLDTVELSRILLPTSDSFKLSDLAIKEGLKHDRPHQADSDAYVTAELLLILKEKIEFLPLNTLRQLNKLSGGLKSDLDLLLDDIIIRKEQKIEYIPNHLEIFKGLTLKKEAQTETTTTSLDFEYPYSEDAKELLLKSAFDLYEKRQGQYKMMDTVYHSFNVGKHSLIEAGTGVGKSLAYLIPAAYFSKQKGQPIVIATYTTQLQEQLLSKDILILKKIIPFQVKITLLKGKDHYINLFKFVLSLKDKDDNYDSTLTKMQILVWLTETSSGDMDELNLSSGGLIYWNKIKNTESHKQKDKEWLSKDFYLRTRKAAENADLIITNHSLLLFDLVQDKKILPSYNYLIVDEGHHLAKTAGRQTGFALDYLNLRLLIGQFGYYEQKQLYYKFETLRNNVNIKNNEIPQILDVNGIVSELLMEMDDFFKAVISYTKKRINKRNYNRVTCRLRFESRSKEWNSIELSAERFSFLLKDLIDVLEKRLQLFSSVLEKLSIQEKILLEEVTSFIKELINVRDNIKYLFKNDHQSEYVTWVELDTRAIQNTTKIYAQPISVASYLKESLFNMKKSVILTSATLTVNHSFTYFSKELGFENNNVGDLIQINSPFHYEKQVRLVIPTDLPEINSVPIDDYIAAITEHIITIAEATKGRMLLLFTSHEMLRKTFELIKESGLLEDYFILAQGVTSGSNARLARNFQRYDKSILLGTNSFWEGIDIPGEDLSCLIIVRLPFSPPDDPFTEAKCEKIKNSGGNPFAEYSLPEAVLRFKQGFGRLIRSAQDRGLIVVFDRRIVTTKYGNTFLKSIPSIPVVKNSIDELVELINLWLE